VSKDKHSSIRSPLIKTELKVTYGGRELFSPRVNLLGCSTKVEH